VLYRNNSRIMKFRVFEAITYKFYKIITFNHNNILFKQSNTNPMFLGNPNEVQNWIKGT